MKNLFSKPFLCCLLAVLLSVTFACKKDKKATDCPNIENEGYSVTVNGNAQPVAFPLHFTGGGVEYRSHEFRFSTNRSDCNTLDDFTLKIDVPPGTTLNDTYTINTEDDSDVNEMYGTYRVENLTTGSATTTAFKSGTIHIQDKGSDKFSFNMNATTDAGENVKLVGDVQF